MHMKSNIAVIGSGISGLSCAWLLSRRHSVTLFEKDDRFGGHSNTCNVELNNQTLAVDTGFMVFNPVNYPNLTALFKHLGVATRPTDMSFSVSVDNGALEYAGSDLNGLFAQRSNLFSPAFWSMLADLLRFYREAPQLMAEIPATLTLGELLEQQGYSQRFQQQHLLPMGAAIWSTPMDKMLNYPALTFLRFCANHGLLQLRDRPQWYTIDGGSRVYVDRLLAQLGSAARNHAGIRTVRRQTLNGKTQVTLIDWQGNEQHFDHVVFACHADQALAMLRDPSDAEQSVLGAFRFERNRALLHSDPALMPRRKAAWSSWNYLSQSRGDQAVAVTYWMNKLQHLPEKTPLLVTLNPITDPKPESIHAAFLYDHPLFDLNALAAQRKLWDLQGNRHTWFCGAWCGYGFHEDGLQAGLAVAEALGGEDRPWQVPGMYDRVVLPPGWRDVMRREEAA
ncbi:NAD(P)/FAD-dependent oxidoreductase [Motiliproteus sediminis]|uniref:NAD(P)/FAD-dependent oxidoreductase n=1 Tax=Motiliproteus sediminis TaxID=1468178 RepID=UPI001AEF9557|nr:FAD-dependent oxidoreductase [Motiliproteus sediminis]